MEYPRNFPEHLQLPVDVAIAEAEAEFIRHPRGSLGEALWQYAVKIYFAFGDQVCQEVRERLCSGSTARWQMETFWGSLLHRTYWQKNRGEDSSAESQDSFRTRMTRRIRASEKWGDYQRSVAAALESLKPESKVPELTEVPTTPKHESVAEQIEKLREESRLTFEELAEKIRVDPRTVQRHTAGDSIPYNRHISAYEVIFSKLLNRKIVIKKCRKDAVGIPPCPPW